MALGNPFEMFAEARRSRDQNARQDLEAMESAGQSINSTLQAFAQRRKQAEWQKTINGLVNDPNVPDKLKALLPLFAQRPELLGQMGPVLEKIQAPKMEWSVIPGMKSAGGHPIMVNRVTGETKEAPMQAEFRPPAPRPISPVPEAKLDVDVQKANRPGMLDSLFPDLFGKPKITNPLKPSAADPLGILK